MNALLLAASLVWSIVVLTIGYPSVKLPDGGPWVLGIVALIAIAAVPWLGLVYKRFRDKKS